jgi:hypothetical protein
MAIYLRYGMPIELTAAERRLFWRIEKKSGNVDILYREPTSKQLRNAEEVAMNWTWFAKAKCMGKYPDGSGRENIGDEIEGMAEADGFIHTNDMIADDGIREIYDACAKFQPMTADELFENIVGPALDRLAQLQPA